MKESVSKNENISRTLEYPSSASRQKSILDILQAYANTPSSGSVLPSEKPEPEETPAQEINQTQRKELEKEAGSVKGEALRFAPFACNLPAGSLHPVALQRKPCTVTIKGLTHLVRLNGNSIYEGQQERVLTNGTRITLETSIRIRSRRGPNQEIFSKQDARNPHIYRWIKVIQVENEKVENEKVGNEKVGNEKEKNNPLYIREGTFEGETDIPPGSRDFLFLPADKRTRSRLDQIQFGEKPQQSTASGDGKNGTAGEQKGPWYARPLNRIKKSTAELKHAKPRKTGLSSMCEKRKSFFPPLSFLIRLPRMIM